MTMVKTKQFIVHLLVVNAIAFEEQVTLASLNGHCSYVQVLCRDKHNGVRRLKRNVSTHKK